MFIDDVWWPAKSDFKFYPHWDAQPSRSQIKKIVTNPRSVAKHKFRPLLKYDIKWRRAPVPSIDPVSGNKTLIKREPKVRSIRYACHKDTIVYKYYRNILSKLYENELAEHNLVSNILAYRKIPINCLANSSHDNSPKSPNKSNINFADDAFQRIAKMGRCCVIAVDISKFFDNIDHHLLKRRWCELMGQPRLPADHYAVYKSITDFRWVECDHAIEALGYDNKYSFYKNSMKDALPEQLCKPSEFREKIIDQKLVEKWDKDRGIPQGVPISDILANLVLLQFDKALKLFVENRSGAYYRYSDDILVILPSDGRAVRGLLTSIERELAGIDQNLKISKDKTEIVCFSPDNPKYRCYQLKPTLKPNRKKRVAFDRGITYLGFRYDGKFVYIRESTIANLRGKITRTCKAVTFRHLNQHKEKDLNWLLKRAPTAEVSQKFLQVENFRALVAEARVQGKSPYKSMTFLSYVIRASRVFGDRGCRMKRQIRNINKYIKETLFREIKKKYPLYKKEGGGNESKTY